jgi:uncharacterized protein YbjT (DUF2867 family)
MAPRSTTSLPVFVTGATGRHGATGARVVRELLDRGIPVRALARADDHRASALRAGGADVVIGDLHDQRTFAAALEGVRAAYFTYPVKSGVVEAAANFAAAARSAHVPHVVFMSLVIARADHPSPVARALRLAEDVLGWAGVPFSSLRVAGFFFENLALLHRSDVMGDGVMRNAFADVPLPWIAGQDAGKLAAAALLNPEPTGTDGIVYRAGTELLTQSDISRLLSRHLGRVVRHETIPKDEWVARLVRLAATDDRIDEAMAVHIAETAALLSRTGRSAQPNVPDFEAVTGAKPLSLADALAAGALDFTATAPG